MAGELGPSGLLKHAQDALLQLGGRCEFGAHERGDLWGFCGVAGDLHGQLAHAVVAHDLAADQKGIAGGEGGGKSLFNLAQGFEIAFEADLYRIGILDRANVHTDPLCRARVAQLPLAVGGLQQAFPFVVGAQRVAAGCAKCEAIVEVCAGEGSIGAGARDFAIEIIRMKRPGAGAD